MFALIFSIVGASFFEKVSTTTKIKSYYKSYLDADLYNRNKIEGAYYKELHKKEKPPKDKNAAKEKSREEKKKPRKSNETEEKKQYHSQRRSITESSKLNIYPLIIKDSPLLAKTLERLLDEAYKETPIYQEGKKRFEFLSKLLAKEIVLSLRAMPESERHLARVTITDPKLKEIFIELFRGSYDYDPKEETGFAPLPDLITLEKNEKQKPVCIRKARPELLKAFLGEELADEIMEKEKARFEETGKKKALLKEDIESLLTASEFVEHKKLLQYEYNQFAKQTHRTTLVRHFARTERTSAGEEEGER